MLTSPKQTYWNIQNKIELIGDFIIGIFIDWSNPMNSNMLDRKIQPDLTHVKTIQYDAIGGVLDWSYTSEE